MHMNTIHKKFYKKEGAGSTGFTLIELLVVIAIIGILASVVLASLNSARAKGADAAVKGGMANMAAQIELYYDNNGNSYGASSTCTNTGTNNVFTGTGAFGDSVVLQALQQISKNSAGGAVVTCNTDANGQAWAISTTLKGGPGGTAPDARWCVDNSGWRNPGTATAGKCL